MNEQVLQLVINSLNSVLSVYYYLLLTTTLHVMQKQHNF